MQMDATAHRSRSKPPPSIVNSSTQPPQFGRVRFIHRCHKLAGHGNQLTPVLTDQERAVDRHDLPSLDSKFYCDLYLERKRHLPITRPGDYLMRHSVAFVLGVAQSHSENLILCQLLRLLSYTPSFCTIS